MATEVVPGGAQACTFTNSVGTFSLNAKLVSFVDTRKPRIASHEILKRDGAQSEPMGRAPHVVKMQLYFLSNKDGSRQNWLSDFQEFAIGIDKDPDGDLIHPAFGKMHVTCQGFDGASVDFEHAVDMYTVPVSFIENNFDQTLAYIAKEGLASTQQQVTVRTDTLQEEIDSLAASIEPSAASVAAASYAAQMISAALSFASATASSASLSTLDTSLSRQLSDVYKFGVSTREQLDALPTHPDLSVIYPTLLAIEQVYAACLDLQRAAILYRPQPFLYTVPSPIHIAALATKFYGKDGRGRIDEILTNNPGRIPNPAYIAQGTVLVLATPTNPNAFA